MVRSLVDKLKLGQQRKNEALESENWDSRMNATMARQTANLWDETETMPIFRTLLQPGREAWRLPFLFTKEGIDWTHETGKNALFPVCRLLLLKS